MNKRIQSYGSIAFIGMVWMSNASALTGNMFQVTSTGAAATIPIKLCLSAGNSKPNSQSGCETFTATGTTLGIRLINLKASQAVRLSACPTYSNVGLQVLDSNYTVATGGTLNSATGYYAFSASCSGDSTVTLASTTDTSINITTAQANRFMTVASTVPPVLQAALNLTIQNTGNLANATDITVTNKANCPNMVVDATSCTNVPIGGSCDLTLTSATPYAPCTISIKGTNTNTVTTTVAFKYLNGWVFASNGTAGKVAANTDITNQQWTNTSVDITGAESNTDGAANTTAITGNASCIGSTTNCAAYQCRNAVGLGADWYLPAKDELDTVYTQLKVNQFGGFADDVYWSSTEGSDFPQGFAWSQLFVNGLQNFRFKSDPLEVRCVRAFTP